MKTVILIMFLASGIGSLAFMFAGVTDMAIYWMLLAIINLINYHNS